MNDNRLLNPEKFKDEEHRAWSYRSGKFLLLSELAEELGNNGQLLVKTISDLDLVTIGKSETYEINARLRHDTTQEVMFTNDIVVTQKSRFLIVCYGEVVRSGIKDTGFFFKDVYTRKRYGVPDDLSGVRVCGNVYQGFGMDLKQLRWDDEWFINEEDVE